MTMATRKQVIQRMKQAIIERNEAIIVAGCMMLRYYNRWDEDRLQYKTFIELSQPKEI